MDSREPTDQPHRQSLYSGPEDQDNGKGARRSQKFQTGPFIDNQPQVREEAGLLVEIRVVAAN
jgi:hypothetical protein